jgi:hypothetical protein
MFDELFKIVISNREPISRRAIWSLDYCIEKSPELLKNSQKIRLIEMLESFCHEGLQRHCLRILARYEIPESHLGKLINICFDILLNPKSSIASKAWSMEILYDFSLKEPEIKPELIAAIEFQKETKSAGIKNKIGKMLKKLNY